MNDASSWQAFNALVLTVLGLGISVLLWRTRGAASGIRGLGWSLLPIAAFLTGTLRLLWQIGDAVVDWALRLAFSPLVWAGIVVLGVSVVLFVVSGLMRRRGLGTKGRRPRSRRDRRRERSAEPLPAGRQPAGRPPAGGQPEVGTAGATDDLADIEAILKKHGIS